MRLPENKLPSDIFMGMVREARRENRVIIYIDGYPDYFYFELDAKKYKEFRPLDSLETYCHDRNRIVREQMAIQDIYSPYHAYEDYVVEVIRTGHGWERWYLGS